MHFKNQKELDDYLMRISWQEGREPLKPFDPLYNVVMDGLPKQAYPDDNPKTAIGVTKAPYHLVPPVAIHHTAAAFADGAKKYGPYNWREKRVSSSVYYGAALRHLTAWWDGEDLSQDAQVHHLGHVMACCAIILDGMGINMLNDDRPTKGAVSTLQAVYGKQKETNDRQVSTDSLPASSRKESLLPMAGRSGSPGNMAGNGGPVCDPCGESCDGAGTERRGPCG